MPPSLGVGLPWLEEGGDAPVLGCRYPGSMAWGYLNPPAWGCLGAWLGDALIWGSRMSRVCGTIPIPGCRGSPFLWHPDTSMPQHRDAPVPGSGMSLLRGMGRLQFRDAGIPHHCGTGTLIPGCRDVPILGHGDDPILGGRGTLLPHHGDVPVLGCKDVLIPRCEHVLIPLHGNALIPGYRDVPIPWHGGDLIPGCRTWSRGCTGS